MSYQIVSIKNRNNWVDFFGLPKQIYRHDPKWVAPLESNTKALLNPKKNPYFKQAELAIFLCYLGKELVSRAILVINYDHWYKWKKKTAFFGFFESYNDQQAVQALMEHMQAYAKSKGAQFLEGPFNPNHYNELGLLIKNFEAPPLFFETYNIIRRSRLYANAHATHSDQ